MMASAAENTASEKSQGETVFNVAPNAVSDATNRPRTPTSRLASKPPIGSAALEKENTKLERLPSAGASVVVVETTVVVVVGGVVDVGAITGAVAGGGAAGGVVAAGVGTGTVVGGTIVVVVGGGVGG